MNKKIDIIIPAYKAQKTIQKALASIVAQSISDDCEVYIINDGDPKGHWFEYYPFWDLLSINPIELKKNVGCGLARQAGIDSSNSPYLVFLDADDEFYHPYALEIMLAAIEGNPSSPLAIADFTEIVRAPGLQMYKHKQDFVWMFGKIYSRKYLTDHNIRFHDSNANEDNGYNTIIQLFMAEERMSAVMIDDIVYSWNFNSNSITRTNDYEYSFNQNVVGYTENMLYAINFVQAAIPQSEKATLKIIEVMYNLYTLYVKSIEFKPEFSQQTFNCCLKFYKEKFRDVSALFEEESLKTQIIRHAQSKAPLMKDYLPCCTFYQLIDDLLNIVDFC